MCVVRTVLLTAGILFLGNQMFSQSGFNIDLKEKLESVEAINAFIRKDFVDISPEMIELLEKNHSLSFDKFNKQLKPGPATYSFSGIQVSEAYALNVKQGFALYLMIDGTRGSIKTLVSIFGLPENVLDYREVENGGFDFLFWKLKQLSIWLNKDIFGNAGHGTNGKAILLITNMKRDELTTSEDGSL